MLCCSAQSEWLAQEPQPAIGSLTRDVLHLTAIQYLQYWSVTTASLKLCCCLELFHNFQCVEVFPASLSLATSVTSFYKFIQTLCCSFRCLLFNPLFSYKLIVKSIKLRYYNLYFTGSLVKRQFNQTIKCIIII